MSRKEHGIGFQYLSWPVFVTIRGSDDAIMVAAFRSLIDALIYCAEQTEKYPIGLYYAVGLH